ncbi:Rpn family recombination-promoting nuclease/putative transposase [Baaleninema simplex]|uniref:Rpn family recombination-promoting nuclease/putative transposase n=1 Tax=Baaleninema simplex TaxID=2862350 RepID=UPI0003473E02|nr:Rpn family recombination-promoting nuclease/putative transposase [Baaleninema simplex]
MFDIVCKFLVESFASDFASWLLGEAMPLTELSPSELSLEPIRADALVLLQSTDTVLHVEFQTRPEAEMAFRMADYRLRVYRRFPEKQMRQVVVYLKPSQSAFVYQNTFEIPGTRHEFEVVRLWEQPPELFLSTPGLLPLAVLARSEERTELLQQVAREIQRLRDRRTQSNLTASAAILAGLLLETELIQQIFRREIMQESVVFREIWEEALQEGRQAGLQEGLQEGRQAGLQEGLQEGRREEGVAMVLRLLHRRIGEIPPEISSQIAALPLAQIEALGEALLDFTSLADLQTWWQELPSK